MKFLILLLLAVFAAVSEAQRVLLSSGLTCQEKKEMLDEHNKLRLMIAKGELESVGVPKASNMQKLVWEDGLEDLAQAWAMNMTFQHSPSRKHAWFRYVGENLAYGNAPKFDHFRSIALWFDEYKSFPYGKLLNYNAGHYTQFDPTYPNTVMRDKISPHPARSTTEDPSLLYSYYECDEKITVRRDTFSCGYTSECEKNNSYDGLKMIWADTLYLGCGFTRFIHPNKSIYKFYVCHYGPSGNYIGSLPYKTGPGCEDLCCKDQCKRPLYGKRCEGQVS